MQVLPPVQRGLHLLAMHSLSHTMLSMVVTSVDIGKAVVGVGGSHFVHIGGNENVQAGIHGLELESGRLLLRGVVIGKAGFGGESGSETTK